MSAFGGKADMISPLEPQTLWLCPLRAIATWRRCCFPKVGPSRVRRLTVDIADFGVRPLAGHIEPSKATCRIRPTTNANLMVTPPIFCAGYSATRSATASAHLPPKYPSCRGVTQDFAKSFGGQHEQPLSKRTGNIYSPLSRVERTRKLTDDWTAPVGEHERAAGLDDRWVLRGHDVL